MQQIRNFILRLSITYVVLHVIAALPGIQIEGALLSYDLFAVWLVALVFTLLTSVVRPILLALTIPFIVMTFGLFIFVIDGVLLLLTSSVTNLHIGGVGWAVLGSVVMSVANTWMEAAFKRVGWLERDAADDPLPMGRPSWMGRIILLLVLLSGVIFSLSMAGQVFLAVASFTRGFWVMVVAAGGALALLVWGIAWLVAEGLALERRVLFSMIVCAAVVIGTGTIGSIAFEQAWVPPAPPPEPRASTAYWDLPTGSRIAYTHVLATSSAASTPLVFLHGGPGLAVLDADIAFYGQFSALGFDVYLYDQIGSGLSGTLDTVGDYSVERHIADLEAIREQIGAVEMVLIGHEFGAELVARYMGLYPDRVEKAIFVSPTPLWDDNVYVFDYSRTATALHEMIFMEPRTALAGAVAALRPDVAPVLVSQEEMRDWMDLSFSLGTMVCPFKSAYKPEPAGGYNYYSYIVAHLSATLPPDPRPLLAQNITPSMILYAECDYVPWEVVLQYRDTLPNVKVYYFKDAGSMIYLLQPEPVREQITAFLTGMPSAQVPYISDVTPRLPQVPDW